MHTYAGQVGVGVPVKFGDSSSIGSRDIQQRIRRMRHFRPFLNFDNCQPEVVSYVISGKADQDVGEDICANFGLSNLWRPRYSEAIISPNPLTIQPARCTGSSKLISLYVLQSHPVELS